MPHSFDSFSFDPASFDTNAIPTPVVGVDVPDHVAAAIARLPQQFKDKTNIVALLTLFATRYQAVESALWQLLTQRTITTAQGVQLDVLGKLTGQPRQGLGDDDYRAWITARIRTSSSHGLSEDLIAIALLLLQNPTANVFVDSQGAAAAVVRILSAITSDSLANALLDFLQQGASAGVRIIVETLYALDPGTWTFALSAFASGALSVNQTTIPVDSTASFPASGSLDVDFGVSGVETVSYAGITPTSFIGVSRIHNSHVSGTQVSSPTNNQPGPWMFLNVVGDWNQTPGAGANYGIAYSVTTIAGDGYLQFVANHDNLNNNWHAFGLAANPLAQAAPINAAQFSWMLRQDTAHAVVWENGASQFDAGAWNTGDVFAIQRTGTAVKYYKNGILQFTSASTSSGAIAAIYFFLATNGTIGGAQLFTGGAAASGGTSIAINWISAGATFRLGTGGEEMGDTSNLATGGQLISARDAHFPAGT